MSIEGAITAIVYVAISSVFWMPLVALKLGRARLRKVLYVLLIFSALAFAGSMTQASDRNRYQWESVFVFLSTLLLLFGVGTSFLVLALRDTFRR